MIRFLLKLLITVGALCIALAWIPIVVYLIRSA